MNVRIVSFLLTLIVLVTVLSGCAPQQSISTDSTEQNTETESLYAVDLIGMPVSEIVELMGGDFELEFSGEHLVWYTSGGLCFFNEDTLPGYAFFLDNYGDVDYSEEDYTPENHFDEIRNNILTGNCGNIRFMGVYDGGAYDENIAVGMSYIDISEAMDSYELSPLVADGSMKQPIQYQDSPNLPSGIIYYDTAGEEMQYYEQDGAQYPDTRWARSINPTSYKMAVFPVEDATEDDTEEQQTDRENIASAILTDYFGYDKADLSQKFGDNYSNITLPESGLADCISFDSLPTVGFGFSNDSGKVQLIGIKECDQSVNITDDVKSDMNGSQLLTMDSAYTVSETYAEMTGCYYVILRNDDGLIISCEWDTSDYKNTVPDFIAVQYV